MKKFNKLFLFSIFICLSLTSVALAASLVNSPSACSGQWTSCEKAFANDTNRATASVTGTSNKTGVWNNYNFTIPNSASINSVIVQADFFASNPRGYISIRVSGDGGATFGQSHEVGGNTTEGTFLIDVTNDLAWTPTKLNNANFKVNVTCFKKGSGSNPTCNLDWVPVNVQYTPFDFSTSLNPASGTVVQGNNISTIVKETLLGGVSQPVSLSQTGCPQFSTCTFNPSSGTPTYNSTFEVQTSTSTPTGTYQIIISGTGDGKTRNATYTLTVNPPCTRANPLVSIAPSAQSGSPGATLVYTTNVTNNDSSNCSASTFSMSSSILSGGWTWSFTNNTLSISPGASQTTSFSLTSPANSTVGDYNFTNTATNQDAPSYSGTSSAIYQVV